MRRPEFIARQGRRPHGLLGRIVARVMAAETSADNDHALDLLDLQPRDRVLEVGFGHGRTLAKAAARVPRGQLAGIDASPLMLTTARRRNRRSMRAGRMQLALADSARIPHGDGAFDKVYAVHTIYFWSEPLRHLGQIFRVTAAGGRFVLGFSPREDAGFADRFPASVYRIRPLDEVAELIAASGFREVRVATRSTGSRLMAWAVADKPRTNWQPGRRPASRAGGPVRSE